jgi:hypothetical protein
LWAEDLWLGPIDWNCQTSSRLLRLLVFQIPRFFFVLFPQRKFVPKPHNAWAVLLIDFSFMIVIEPCECFPFSFLFCFFWCYHCNSECVSVLYIAISE